MIRSITLYSKPYHVRRESAAKVRSPRRMLTIMLLITDQSDQDPPPPYELAHTACSQYIRSDAMKAV